MPHLQPRRTSGSATAAWDRQLDAYVRPQGGSPSAQRAARSRLADAVRAAPTSPEAWWALLAAEEAALGGTTATLDRAGRGGVSLFDLYRAATQVVPRQGNYNNEAFVRIWLGFARQQWWVGVLQCSETCKPGQSCSAGWLRPVLSSHGMHVLPTSA